LKEVAKTGRTFETHLRAQFNVKPLNVAGELFISISTKHGAAKVQGPEVVIQTPF
jgi:hypothetical protein